MGEAGVQRIVLFGASEAARIVLSVVEQDDGIEVVAIADDSCDGVAFGGVALVPEDGLDSPAWDGVLITALNDLDGADSRLRELEVPESKVWRLS